MRTPRLPVVDGTDATVDLNGLVRFAERRNMVSARVPSHFKRSLQQTRPWLFSYEAVQQFTYCDRQTIQVLANLEMLIHV